MRSIDKRCNTYVGINNDLKNWAVFLPLLGELKDPAMDSKDDRHWNKIKEMVKPKTFEVNAQLKLETIWDLKLFEFKDAIEDITHQAK
jgi:dynein heavy chain